MASFSLLPRHDVFYEGMLVLATHAQTCAHLLNDYVSAQDTAARGKALTGIASTRVAAKATMNGLTDALCRHFVTPFDREDIQHFSHNLYRIPKMIEKAVRRMELHGLDAARPDFARQAAVIVEEAETMQTLARDLLTRRNAKKVVEKARQLQDLEQKGDDVLQALTTALFAETRETRDLLLRKDIYDMLEKVIDCYRNAAAVALQIVLKYG